MSGDGFTVHVNASGSAGVISRADGKARQLSANEASTFLDIAQANAADYSYGDASAVAVASLDEAHAVEPVPGAAAVKSVSAFASDGVEIPLGPLVKPSNLTFEEVLATRRSRRVLAPFDLESLAYVLSSIGRVQDWSDADDGFQLTRRPAPSAGGRHPCELAVVVNAVSGITAGLWWFDALRCMLVAQPPGDSLRRASKAVAAATTLDTDPPATIFVVAHLQRTLSRYPAGSTLVWRDAGAMLSMLHLAATAAGVSSCIAGTSGVLVRDSESLIADVGALVLGHATV